MTAGFATVRHQRFFADFAFANPVIEHVLHHLWRRAEVVHQIVEGGALVCDQVRFDFTQNHRFILPAQVPPNAGVLGVALRLPTKRSARNTAMPMVAMLANQIADFCGCAE